MGGPNTKKPIPKEIPKEILYQQWCEDFRAINEIFWRVPFIAMTLTGGIAFGIGTFQFSEQLAIALFYFVALCNICFIVIVWRLRAGIMKRLLESIHEAEGRARRKGSFAVVWVFTILFLITAVFCAYAANSPSLFSTSTKVNAESRQDLQGCAS